MSHDSYHGQIVDKMVGNLWRIPFSLLTYSRVHVLLLHLINLIHVLSPKCVPIWDQIERKEHEFLVLGVSLDSCMMLDDVAAVRDGESDAVPNHSVIYLNRYDLCQAQAKKEEKTLLCPHPNRPPQKCFSAIVYKHHYHHHHSLFLFIIITIMGKPPEKSGFKWALLK